MNWFERYGIVGAYFILINFWSLYINKIFDLSMINKNSTFIIGIIGIAFLPIGYIVSVFSQLLYYNRLGGRQIHKESLNRLSEDLRKEMQLSNCDSEAYIESKMSTFVRLELGKEKLPHLREFTGKRFDVRSINFSIIVASRFALMLNLIFGFLIFKFNLLRKIEEIIFIFTIILLIRYLQGSNKTMDEQIIDVNTDIFRYIDEERKIIGGPARGKIVLERENRQIH